jgi:hypothetical protein
VEQEGLGNGEAEVLGDQLDVGHQLHLHGRVQVALDLLDELLLVLAVDGEAEQEQEHLLHLLEGVLALRVLGDLVDVGQLDEQDVVEDLLVEGADVAQDEVEVEETRAGCVVGLALVRQVRVGVLQARIRLLQNRVEILAVRVLVVLDFVEI